MTKEQTDLRILSLDVENVLRVQAVHIKPDGRVVELTGRNRQGKSSVIQALWMALGGKDMIPSDPIHDGAEMAKIVVELGDDSGTKYVVTRKIKAKEGGGYALSLTVENEDGFKTDKPQQILNSLIGSLSYDPLQFIEMKPREQYDLLKKFVSGIDFDAVEDANQKDFDARTVINRDAKAKRAQADGVVVDEDLDSDRIDEAELVGKLAEAGNANALVERWTGERNNKIRHVEDLRSLVTDKLADAADLRRQADALETRAGLETKAADEIQAEIEASGTEPQRVDVTALQSQISLARSTNDEIDRNNRAAALRLQLNNEAATLEAQSEALSKTIEGRNEAKTKAIADAALPVPGITFGDGILYYDGHPLSLASQAEKLSIAIAIAAALQPRLRFITTKNAALLDEESWNAMVAMAEERNLLIIAETVGSRRPTAVVIEDGRVLGAVQQAAE